MQRLHDPEVIQAGIQLGGNIEGGARSFADYTRKMIADLGEGARPYLKSWYMAVRSYPVFSNAGMDNEEAIDKAQTEAAAAQARLPLTTKRWLSPEAVKQMQKLSPESQKRVTAVAANWLARHLKSLGEKNPKPKQ